MTRKIPSDDHTAKIIDKIKELHDKWCDVLESGDPADFLKAADDYDANGLKYIAKGLRRRAGIKLPQDKLNSKVPLNAEERMLEVIRNNHKVQPQQAANLLGISRSAADKIAQNLRREGKIKTVNKRFFVLTGD